MSLPGPSQALGAIHVVLAGSLAILAAARPRRSILLITLCSLLAVAVLVPMYWVAPLRGENDSGRMALDFYRQFVLSFAIPLGATVPVLLRLRRRAPPGSSSLRVVLVGLVYFLAFVVSLPLSFNYAILERLLQ